MTENDHTALLVSISREVGEIRATQGQHTSHLDAQDRELRSISSRVNRLERVDAGKVQRRRWWNTWLGRTSAVAGIVYAGFDITSHFVAIPRIPHP